MRLREAQAIAERIRAELAPHCERCEIAGSIRRQKAEPRDIEIVAIPKPYETGLFRSGVATVVEQWKKVKGELPNCKYTQRILPDGIKLDLFFATVDNWGLQFAVRTGSSQFSHFVLARGWVAAGYHSVSGMLMRCKTAVPVRDEEQLFRLIGIPYVEPEKREI